MCSPAAQTRQTGMINMVLMKETVKTTPKRGSFLLIEVGGGSLLLLTVPQSMRWFMMHCIQADVAALPACMHAPYVNTSLIS